MNSIIKHEWETSTWKTVLFILAIIAWIIFGFNYKNPDYNLLKNVYYYGTTRQGEVSFGYQMLITIFKWLGFSYQGFIIVLSAVAIFFMCKAIVNNCNNPIFCFALYLIYPFLIDVVQTRNLIAYVIVLNAIPFLKEKNKKNIIIYILLILLASTFHSSSFLYLIFLLAFLKDTNGGRLICLSLIIAIIAGINIRFLPNLIRYIPILNNSYNQLRYYLTYSNSYMNGMILYAFLIMATIVASYFKNLFNSGKTSIKINVIPDSGEDIDYRFKIIIITICFLPLILINSEFVRVFRNMWIISYMFLLDTSKSKKCEKSFILFCVILVAILFYKELSPAGNYYNSITQMIFKYNLFFDLWK